MGATAAPRRRRRRRMWRFLVPRAVLASGLCATPRPRRRYGGSRAVSASASASGDPSSSLHHPVGREAHRRKGLDFATKMASIFLTSSCKSNSNDSAPFGSCVVGIGTLPIADKVLVYRPEPTDPS
jgi:hypothetical protein